MNIGVIFAGGSGTRMNTKSRPKQFLDLNGKPIIIYTIELFDNHPEIDGIVVVCLGSWIPFLQKRRKKFEITRVVRVIAGGVSGQDSIFKGLCAAEEYAKEKNDDSAIVLIHDGVRPLVDITTIQQNIRVAKMYGCAITAHPVTETVVITDKDSAKIDDLKKRSDTYSMTAPQSFQIGKILYAYEKLKDIDCGDVPLLDAAMVYAKTVGDIQIVKEQGLNIKITTTEDYYYLKAILELQENKYVFGL